MKKRGLLLSLLLIVVLPQLLFTVLERENEPEQSIENNLPLVKDTHQMIRVKDGDQIVEMELDAYVTGVVLGEMPADFELEALKAQAVASRTYTLRKVMRAGKHPDADVCTVSSCCQAFVHESDYSAGEEHLQKVKSAVEATTGQVITYQGSLIEATYFSCSGGKTEDAVAVWGTDVPYLKSVNSPGEENAKYYESELVFSKSQFLAKLGLPSDCCLSIDNISLSFTDAESVDTIMIDGYSISGVQARALLSLPSASFTVELTDDDVLIHTKGNGHRVGMSQYGAEAMAVAGKTYDEILAHYYSGTKLETFSYGQMNAVFDKEENL